MSEIKCQNCNSTRLQKNGFTPSGKRRLKCGECGFRFTINSVAIKPNDNEPKTTPNNEIETPETTSANDQIHTEKESSKQPEVKPETKLSELNISSYTLLKNLIKTIQNINLQLFGEKYLKDFDEKIIEHKPKTLIQYYTTFEMYILIFNERLQDTVENFNRKNVTNLKDFELTDFVKIYIDIADVDTEKIIKFHDVKLPKSINITELIENVEKFNNNIIIILSTLRKALFKMKEYV
jgi:hypothetical protein